MYAPVNPETVRRTTAITANDTWAELSKPLFPDPNRLVPHV
jgi:hypothetical protein